MLDSYNQEHRNMTPPLPPEGKLWQEYLQLLWLVPVLQLVGVADGEDGGVTRPGLAGGQWVHSQVTSSNSRW